MIKREELHGIQEGGCGFKYCKKGKKCNPQKQAKTPIKNNALLIKAQTCSDYEAMNIIRSKECTSEILNTLYKNQNLDRGTNEVICHSRHASNELLTEIFRDGQAYEVIENIIKNPNASDELLLDILGEYNESYIGDYAFEELEKRAETTNNKDLKIMFNKIR